MTRYFSHSFPSCGPPGPVISAPDAETLLRILGAGFGVNFFDQVKTDRPNHFVYTCVGTRVSTHASTRVGAFVWDYNREKANFGEHSRVHLRERALARALSWGHWWVVFRFRQLRASLRVCSDPTSKPIPDPKGDHGRRLGDGWHAKGSRASACLGGCRQRQGSVLVPCLH